jgi:hypothetical protein
VEASGRGEKSEDEKERQWVVEGGSDALRDPVESEKPDVHGDEAGKHSGDEGRQEQRLQDICESTYDYWWDDSDAQLEGEHRIDAFELRRVGVFEDAQRTKFLLDEEGDVLRLEENAQASLDRIGERGVASAAVCRLCDRVKELRELNDLAVVTPDEVRRFFEAGILVASDELDSTGAPSVRLAARVVRSALFIGSPRLPAARDIVFIASVWHC